MKILLPIFVGLFTTAAALAQTPVPRSAATPPARTTTADKIVMVNGALAEIQDHTATRIDLDTILPGGVRVTPGGTVTLPDGSAVSLNDRQMITSNGKISAASAEDIAAASKAISSGTTGPGQRAYDKAAAARGAGAANPATTTSGAATTPVRPAPPDSGGRPMSVDRPMDQPAASASPR